MDELNSDALVFETSPPSRIGDDAIAFVDGKRRMVRLLPSADGGTCLFDMGAVSVHAPYRYGGESW